AFGYFLTHTDERSGLVRDSSREGAPCSIAVVGFALSCYPVGVERGWIARDAAADRVRKALRFFLDSAQSDRPDGVTGYRGFYYHSLDMATGERTWNCELSVIDTTLFVAGALTAAHYFDGTERVDTEIRALAEAIHRR